MVESTEIDNSSVPASSRSDATLDFWREACKEIEKNDAEAWNLLEPMLPSSAKTYSSIADDMSQCILKARDLKETNHTTSQKVKKFLENTLGLIDRFSSTISAIAALNPYASIAWTAVSAILPLVLLPKSENDAAMEGIQIIINLIYVYRIRESSISCPTLRQEANILPRKLKDLYVQILAYEAAFMKHYSAKTIKRIAGDISNHSQWKKRNDELQKLDSEFSIIWESELKSREDKAREDESAWRQEQRKRIEDDAMFTILSLFDTNYHIIKRSKEMKGTRVEGTCGWFLRHPQYSKWLTSKESSILWVSAGPGSGKSVLSLFLFDAREELLKTDSADKPIFCYYFFSNEFPTRNNAAICVRALIHQLLLQQPKLHKNIQNTLKGRNEKEVVNDFFFLWNIFVWLVSDSNIEDHYVICVIDALDECQLNPENKEQGSRENFIEMLTDFYISSSSKKRLSRLKIIITSRPYDSIEGAFVPLVERLENLRLRGEDESKQIQQEIGRVVQVRVKDLAKRKGLENRSQDQLINALNQYDNRTYLWLYLILDHVKRELFHKSSRIEDLVHQMPTSVEEAYERILCDSTNKPRARKLLNIVLGAMRPLTPTETWIALEAESVFRSESSSSSPAKEDQIISVITNLCGLILSVVDGKVMFLHQTAREYLTNNKCIDDPDRVKDSLGWKGIFTLKQSHVDLAESCTYVLCIDERLRKEAELRQKHKSPTSSRNSLQSKDEYRSHGLQLQNISKENIGFFSQESDHNSDAFDQSMELKNSGQEDYLCYNRYTASKSYSSFLHYATRYWTDHMRQAASQIPHVVLQLAFDFIFPSYFLTSSLGTAITRMGLNQGESSRICPLNVAAAMNIVEALRVAKSRGLDYSSNQIDGYHPLAVAAALDRIEAVEFLLSVGVPIDAQVKPFDDPDDFRDYDPSIGERSLDKTALHFATERCNYSIMRILLKNGARSDIYGKSGLLPLHLSFKAFNPIQGLSILLQGGADINAPDLNGITALWKAFDSQLSSSTACFLIKNGANIMLKDESALIKAVQEGLAEVVKAILCREECDERYLNHKDSSGNTALSSAVRKGNISCTSQLLQDPSTDKTYIGDDGRNLLAIACHTMSEENIKFLLADPDVPKTLRVEDAILAIKQGFEARKSALLILLLEEVIGWSGSSDIINSSLLRPAVTGGSAELVEFLFRICPQAIDANEEFSDGETSLSIACDQLNFNVIRVLLSWGASPTVPVLYPFLNIALEYLNLSIKNSLQMENFFRCIETFALGGYGHQMFAKADTDEMWIDIVEETRPDSVHIDSQNACIWHQYEDWREWRIRTLTLLYQWTIESDARPKKVYLDDVIGRDREVQPRAYYPPEDEFKRQQARIRLAEEYWRNLADEGTWVVHGSEPASPIELQETASI